MVNKNKINAKANLLKDLYTCQIESYQASRKDRGILHQEFWEIGEENPQETIFDYMYILEESATGIVSSMIGKYVEKKHYKESCLDFKNELATLPKYYEKEILDWLNIENKERYPTYFNYVFFSNTMLIVAKELLDLICESLEEDNLSRSMSPDK